MEASLEANSYLDSLLYLVFDIRINKRPNFIKNIFILMFWPKEDVREYSWIL